MRGKGAQIADKPLEIIESNVNGQTFIYGEKQFETRMAGIAQPYNAATAIEAAHILKISDNAIYSGVKAAKLNGRIEVLRANGNTYILDGAHNPASFVPLAGFLENIGGADVAVFGSLSDKDIDRNILAIKPYINKIYAVTPDSQRAMDAGKIKATCAKYNILAEIFESVAEALENAHGTVAVCGTFTILKEAESFIKNT